VAAPARETKHHHLWSNIDQISKINIQTDEATKKILDQAISEKAIKVASYVVNKSPLPDDTFVFTYFLNAYESKDYELLGDLIAAFHHKSLSGEYISLLLRDVDDSRFTEDTFFIRKLLFDNKNAVQKLVSQDKNSRNFLIKNADKLDMSYQDLSAIIPVDILTARTLLDEANSLSSFSEIKSYFQPVQHHHFHRQICTLLS